MGAQDLLVFPKLPLSPPFWGLEHESWIWLISLKPLNTLQTIESMWQIMRGESLVQELACL